MYKEYASIQPLTQNDVSQSMASCSVGENRQVRKDKSSINRGKRERGGEGEEGREREKGVADIIRRKRMLQTANDTLTH